MHTCSKWLALACAAVAIPAQDTGRDLRFDFRDGTVVLFDAADADSSPTPVWSPLPVGDFESGFDVLIGPVLMPFMLTPGDSDLASLVDADRFVALTGASDAELLQIVTAPRAAGDAPWVALRRIVAVRAVADRGYKPALGVLDSVLEEEGVDPMLRRAVVETRASLRGEAPPERQPAAIAPLAEALRLAPDGTTVVARIDQWRLPSAAPAARWLRHMHPSWDMSTLLLFRFGLEVEDLEVTLTRNREAVGMFGYELAKLFGNQRIERSVIAVALGEALEQQPEFVLLFQGRFDWTGLAERLGTDLNVEVGADGAITLTARSLHATFTPTYVALRESAPEGLLDEAAASTWAERLGETGAPVVAVRSPDMKFPAGMNLPFVPQRLELTLPRRRTQGFEATMVLDSTAAAEAAASVLGGLPRLLETQAEELPPLDPVVDWANALQLERDGSRVTAKLPAIPFSLDELVLELKKLGVFGG